MKPVSSSEFIKFGTDAKQCHYNRLDSVFTLIKKMQENDDCGYGTNIITVWDMLDKHYDRIFLFSDMQVMIPNWWGYTKGSSAIDAMNDYMRYYGHTHVYSVDAGNYSTQISNPLRGDLTLLTGFSDKVFQMLNILEQGGNIVDYINTHYANVC